MRHFIGPRQRKESPRIWFSKLPIYAQADDVLALFSYHQAIAVLNLTRIDVNYVMDSRTNSPIRKVLNELSESANSTADELLSKLRSISKAGLVRSVMDEPADTAVGRSLESALGISMNPSREPDYNGIELKSYRPQATRRQLFAKVPNWRISKFSSMAEVLDAFGYDRNGREQLNCTVSASKPNSQGLVLSIDDKAETLLERSVNTQHGAFVSWYLSELRDALESKHNETFWIKAKSHLVNGRETLRASGSATHPFSASITIRHIDRTRCYHTRPPDEASRLWQGA